MKTILSRNLRTNQIYWAVSLSLMIILVLLVPFTAVRGQGGIGGDSTYGGGPSDTSGTGGTTGGNDSTSSNGGMATGGDVSQTGATGGGYATAAAAETAAATQAAGCAGCSVSVGYDHGFGTYGYDVSPAIGGGGNTSTGGTGGSSSYLSCSLIPSTYVVPSGQSTITATLSHQGSITSPYTTARYLGSSYGYPSDVQHNRSPGTLTFNIAGLPDGEYNYRAVTTVTIYAARGDDGFFDVLVSCGFIFNVGAAATTAPPPPPPVPSGPAVVNLEYNLSSSPGVWQPANGNTVTIRHDDNMTFRYRTQDADTCLLTNIHGPSIPANIDWEERLDTSRIPKPQAGGNPLVYRVSCWNNATPGQTTVDSVSMVVPPAPTIAMTGRENGTLVPAGSPIAPGSDLQILWNINGPVDSCTYSAPLATPANPIAPSGSQLFSRAADTVANGGASMTPGMTTTFRVTCSGMGGIAQGSIDYYIPLPSITFTVDPRVVRQGETSNFNWSVTTSPINPPYDLNCSLTGGAYTSPYTFTVPATANGGRPTSPLNSAFSNRLTCTEPISGHQTSADNYSEVIPALQEI